jgi:hypothetical protein
MKIRLALLALLLAFSGLTACKTTCPKEKSGGATGGSGQQELPQPQQDPGDGLPLATTAQMTAPEAAAGK